MPTVIPRHVLCALGNWHSLDEVESIVRQEVFSGFELDREFSQLWPDDRMMSAFDSSYDRVSPSMEQVDWNAVQAHSAVAYVLSPPVYKEYALSLSARALFLTAALLRGGAVAVKNEGAGIAHGRAGWLELASEFARARKNGDTHSEGGSLYWAWVRRPMIDDDQGVYYSCGMHLLGEPDVEIATSVGLDDALEWIDMLCLYLVADRPTRQLKPGDGFRLRDVGPRRVMSFRPCERYEEDGFKFNPYGYIRLEPAERRS